MITRLRKMPKTGIGFMMCFIFIWSSINMVYGSEVAALNTETISFSGGSSKVSYITIDLNNQDVSIESVVANNRVGTVGSLEEIVNIKRNNNQEVLAAINGTFFSAYNDNPLPWGTIIQGGKVIHVGNTGSAIGFTNTNEVEIDHLYISIQGTINEFGQWYAWNINHTFDNDDAITIITPEFGKETHNHNFTSITVDGGRVVNIKTGKVSIPQNGYVIVTGLQSIISRFKVGDTVAYNISFNQNDFKNQIDSSGKDITSKWQEISSAIGAGPTLIKNGVITANGEAEGFFEDKILTNKGQRSFIGTTKENKLVMGTASAVSIKELAEICKKLGLDHAINLDGGASSGLLYKDKMVIKPGRLLSNAIVVTRDNKKVQKVEPEIKIRIDGSFLETNTPPAVVRGRTMIPFKDIFTALGAEVQWNEKEAIAVGIKGYNTIELPIDKNYALKNGEEIKLDVAAILIQGRTYIPVKFVAESLGAKVNWDAINGVVDIWTE